MKEIWSRFSSLLQSPYGTLELSIIFIIVLCACAVFTSILINFIESRQRPKASRERKSIVTTATMTVFFIGFYLVIRLGIGGIVISNIALRVAFALSGTFMVIAGTIINIRGRLMLGVNWADQVKIYDDQTLVSKDIYSLVRHPLYSSLMLIFYGGSLIYLNWLAFLANSLIFIPFMYYRAKQEESLLIERFSQYRDYQKKVGMFFPRLTRRQER
ncbi:MAG: isoprenylcysteine carboxylmethyltransferase family protein [Candidatus Omnitrophica bacterium]|nr:isoprenylcysteine carboxylmethyltransferase family protein [Candidatus Omnitrophota bacterium]